MYFDFHLYSSVCETEVVVLLVVGFKVATLGTGSKGGNGGGMGKVLFVQTGCKTSFLDLATSAVKFFEYFGLVVVGKTFRNKGSLGYFGDFVKIVDTFRFGAIGSVVNVVGSLNIIGGGGVINSSLGTFCFTIGFNVLKTTFGAKVIVWSNDALEVMFNILIGSVVGLLISKVIFCCCGFVDSVVWNAVTTGLVGVFAAMVVVEEVVVNFEVGSIVVRFALDLVDAIE